MSARAWLERSSSKPLAVQAFLDASPSDLYVGIVLREVETVLPPTTDRAALATELAALRLSTGTRLYDGVLEAVQTAGEDGQRNILVL